MEITPVWSDNYYFSFINEAMGSESLCNLPVSHDIKSRGKIQIQVYLFLKSTKILEK